MKNPNVLQIQHISASVEGKEILHDVSLTVRSGTVHALMGPNGSGKSTLASLLMGHPSYGIVGLNRKHIILNGRDITGWSTEDRAKAGLFLAFQSPVAVPGVTVMNILRSAYEAINGKNKKETASSVQNPLLSRRRAVGSMSILQFNEIVKGYARKLHIEDSFLTRGIHDGFSGGEKKKIEMLQALVLRPKYAFFDEIDTGLDVDALKIVASGVNILRRQGTGIIIITHYQRILRYVSPDVVHILVDGSLVKTGDRTLAHEIEKKGYASYVKTKTVQAQRV